MSQHLQHVPTEPSRQFGPNRSFPTLNLIHRRPIHPHAKIARVAMAFHRLRRFLRDLQLLPFPLHHLSILFEIFPRRLRRIPRRRHSQHRKFLALVLEQFIRSARQMRRQSLALFRSGVLGEQHAEIQLAQRAIGQLAEIARLGQRRRIRDYRSAMSQVPLRMQDLSAAGRRTNENLGECLAPQLPKYRVLKRQPSA